VSDIVERLRWWKSEVNELFEAADEIERLRSRSETLEAALRAMESAFVLLTKTMQGSEIGIPLDVGLIIVNAREVARAALPKG
jgi:hypothetical protein